MPSSSSAAAPGPAAPRSIPHSKDSRLGSTIESLSSFVVECIIVLTDAGIVRSTRSYTRIVETASPKENTSTPKSQKRNPTTKSSRRWTPRLLPGLRRYAAPAGRAFERSAGARTCLVLCSLRPGYVGADANANACPPNPHGAHLPPARFEDDPEYARSESRARFWRSFNESCVHACGFHAAYDYMVSQYTSLEQVRSCFFHTMRFVVCAIDTRIHTSLEGRLRGTVSRSNRVRTSSQLPPLPAPAP